jgi:AcrR family transcriptional regulator
MRADDADHGTRTGRTGGADEREAIIRAAYHLIGGQGRSPASVHEILAEARLSTRAFYRHFGSKDELIVQMFVRDNDRFTASLREAVQRAGSTDLALQAWLDEFLDAAYQPRRADKARRLISREVLNATGLEAANELAAREHRRILTEVLAGGAVDGTFPRTDPTPDAYCIHAVVTAYMRARLDGRATRTSRATARNQVTGFALRAIGRT